MKKLIGCKSFPVFAKNFSFSYDSERKLKVIMITKVNLMKGSREKITKAQTIFSENLKKAKNKQSNKNTLQFKKIFYHLQKIRIHPLVPSFLPRYHSLYPNGAGSSNIPNLYL